MIMLKDTAVNCPYVKMTLSTTITLHVIFTKYLLRMMKLYIAKRHIIV